MKECGNEEFKRVVAKVLVSTSQLLLSLCCVIFPRNLRFKAKTDVLRDESGALKTLQAALEVVNKLLE